MLYYEPGSGVCFSLNGWLLSDSHNYLFEGNGLYYQNLRNAIFWIILPNKHETLWHFKTVTLAIIQ